MTIQDSLEQIGLSKKETNIYLYLLQCGPSTPTQIAQGTSISRPNVYDFVRSLAKSGLIYFQLINKKRLIVASDPQKLRDVIKQKMDIAEAVIPTLKSVDFEGSFQSKVTFFQGKKGMQNLFNQALDMKGKELWGVWAAKDMDKILGKKIIEEFIAQRVKKGIRLKSLRPIEKESFYDNETVNLEGRKLTEAAYVSEAHVFSLSMSIYDNKVAFFSSKKESYGFLVESPEFSEMQRMLYTIAWNNSGKLKNL